MGDRVVQSPTEVQQVLQRYDSLCKNCNEGFFGKRPVLVLTGKGQSLGIQHHNFFERFADLFTKKAVNKLIKSASYQLEKTWYGKITGCVLRESASVHIEKREDLRTSSEQNLRQQIPVNLTEPEPLTMADIQVKVASEEEEVTKLQECYRAIQEEDWVKLEKSITSLSPDVLGAVFDIGGEYSKGRTTLLCEVMKKNQVDLCMKLLNKIPANSLLGGSENYDQIISNESTGYNTPLHMLPNMLVKAEDNNNQGMLVFAEELIKKTPVSCFYQLNSNRLDPVRLYFQQFSGRLVHNTNLYTIVSKVIERIALEQPYYFTIKSGDQQTGITPLHRAIRITGKDTDKDVLKKTDELFKRIINSLDVKKLSEQYEDDNGNTLLHYAIQEQNWHVATLLVEKLPKSDTMLKNEDNNSPLDLLKGLDPSVEQQELIRTIESKK